MIVCGEKFNISVPIGFANGCKTAIVSKLYNRDYKDNNEHMHMLFGLSDSQNLLFYNLDNLIMWINQVPGKFPLILSHLKTLPKWIYPSKVSFYPYNIVEDKQLSSYLIASSLANIQTRDDLLEIVYIRLM